MSIFKEMKNRQSQKKANDFIKGLKNKSEKDIEQAYLDNKEFESSETVLSYLFFNHPNLIRILPLEFQKQRLNSNLTMFNYGSIEAKKSLVSSWLHENKFFMNALVVGFDEEEYNSFIRMYFTQPKDVALLYMDDLEKVLKILNASDVSATEKILKMIQNDLTDKQWEYVIKVNPMFIKYASQEVQTKYASDNNYTMYINGDARKKYIQDQMNLVKNDISILKTLSIDIQKEYILQNPHMISHIEEDILIELLKYDINLIRYVNIPSLRKNSDKSQEVLYAILENSENKTIKEIVNIFIDKGILNAKGKLYRFDEKSNNLSYQYTKRIIRIIQSLSIEQIKMLIAIDVNYVLPYVVPVYNDETDRKVKENIIIDCNSRCLNLFKSYYDEKIHEDYYKVINKIYNEYLSKIDKYDYTKDYDCIFDLLKILFNKKIIRNNPKEKVFIYIGSSIFYKDSDNKEFKKVSIKILNELLEKAYNKKIDNDKPIYDLYSLEVFDENLSFIDKQLLEEYNSHNFVNMSSLLFYVKSDKVRALFKKYYETLTNIYDVNKETLFKAVENFTYYKNIIKVIEDETLTDKELTSLVNILSTYSNHLNIKTKEELNNYEFSLLKKLIMDLSAVKDENIYKNLLCKYLFNKSYNQQGNSGWLDTDTLEQIFDTFDEDSLLNSKINEECIFTDEEINLFRFAKLLFQTSEFGIILSFIDNVISNSFKINYVAVAELFNKLKKYKKDIINNNIATIEDLELMYISRPDVISKRTLNGIDIYTVSKMDFKVLTSTTDDGIHYCYTSISNLEKNSYGYSSIPSEASVRFVTSNNQTIIKLNKDTKEKYKMDAESIIVVASITEDIFNIAQSYNLKIIEVRDE